MNVLFVTIAWPDINSYNLYTDLIDEFIKNKHEVTVAAISDYNKYDFYCRSGINVIHIPSGKIQKTNKYLKVINSFIAGFKIKPAIKKYLDASTNYDLIIFPTPPITMTPSIIFLKLHYHAKLYLLLKDIWPQDIVDIGGMKKGGIVWSIFRILEKITYKFADNIGCMSPKAVKYIIENNSKVSLSKIEVCPNCQHDRFLKDIDRNEIRKKYSIPLDKKVYIYGGNLGIPQGVEFLPSIANRFACTSDLFLLVVGCGTEYDKLQDALSVYPKTHVIMLPSLPKNDYEQLVSVSDVGIILLHSFATVPNFPSRLLSYLNAGIPIVAAVDDCTDIGVIIDRYQCGRYCKNGDIEGFMELVESYRDEQVRKNSGIKSRNLFLNCYTADIGYQIIMQHYGENVQNCLENEYALRYK